MSEVSGEGGPNQVPINGEGRPGLARLAVGLGQGAILYGLYKAVEVKAWPATEAMVFAPAFTLALFLPLSALFAVGAMRPRILMAWLGGTAALLVGLALHDLSRRGSLPPHGLWVGAATLMPTPTLLVCVAAALFIAQSLATAGVRDGRAVAAYPTYFDTAWKFAVQLHFAFSFVGVMWAILFLGAGLFQLIGLDFLYRLIRHAWFSIPVSTLALAAAVHLTDVRAGIVRAIRALVSVLQSWLLPLMTVILAGFLVSLAFTGLDLLWKTGRATALLLSAAAGLVVLINAAYQDGLPDHAPPAVLRWAGRVAAGLILPLMMIAAYALYLRVAQHGWTVDRILAATCIAIGGLYGLGYLRATLALGGWLKHLEPANVGIAVVTVATILALLSPLADPARIAVASQVDRLLSGRVVPERFDFASLRRWGGRYGDAALTALAEDEATAPTIRTPAAQALQAQLGSPAAQLPLAAGRDDIAANLMVPAGTTLPESFLRRDWTAAAPSWQIPNCLKRRGERCEAFLLDLTGDGRDDILLVPAGTGLTVLFAGSDRHDWPLVATSGDVTLKCPRVLDSLRSGQARPTPPAIPDLAVAGRQVRLTPLSKPAAPCP